VIETDDPTPERRPRVSRRKTGWFCWTCGQVVATSQAGTERHVDTVHHGGRIETGPHRPDPTKGTP